MKKFAAILFAASVALAATPSAEASVRAVSGIEMQRAYRAGLLTPAELRHLEADQARLDAVIRAAFRDGRVTRLERKRIRALERSLEREFRIMVRNRVRR